MGKGHGHGSHDPDQKRHVEGFDFLLPCLVIGTWIAFVIFGLAQEGVTRTKFGQGEDAEKFEFTTFLVLLQSVGNAAVAAVIMVATTGTKTNFSASIPLSEWLIVALGYAGAHKFGLWSLKYIPFPLQVLLKSCKTIPVMIGSLLLDRTKTPKMKDIIMVLVLTTGIAIFMFFKPSKKQDDTGLQFSEETMIGMGMVVLALICDAIYGPYQDKIVNGAKKLKEAKGDAAPDPPSSYHLMFNMNFYQGIIALAMIGGHIIYEVVAEGKDPANALATNELALTARFVQKHPEIVLTFLQFSLAMAFGNVFIYSLQRHYGAVVVTTTTTLRKFLSVLASALPKEGICGWIPVLPEGLCGVADFRGCALISCASITGFGNQIVSKQWLGVLLVVLSKNISTQLCKIFEPEKKKTQ